MKPPRAPVWLNLVLQSDMTVDDSIRLRRTVWSKERPCTVSSSVRIVKYRTVLPVVYRTVKILHTQGRKHMRIVYRTAYGVQY